MAKKIPIIIVAGGLATRMLPLTEHIPKCLIDLNSRPLIEHQLNFFKKSLFTEIIFCVAYLADKVKAHFNDGENIGLHIRYVQETQELMGTAGSVKLAEHLIDSEEFMVYYGDNITNMDFDKLIEFHRSKKGIATVCVRPLPQQYKSSSIIMLDDDAKIQVFLENPTIEQTQAYRGNTQYINSGIYVLNKRIFEYIPNNQKFDFAKELFPKIMRDNAGLYGYATTEFFREIGRVDKYEQFLKEIHGKKYLFPDKNKAIFLDRDGVINQNILRLIKPGQFDLLPGSAEAIREINKSGYLAIIVSNQPDIAKGFFGFSELEKIHDKMKAQLKQYSAYVDDIYVCPHHPESGFAGEVKELKIDCDCRKPKPGLILKAIAEYNIDPTASYMIGDSKTDIEAGRRAGVMTVLLDGEGSGSRQEKNYTHIIPDIKEYTLLGAVRYILKSNQHKKFYNR